MLARGAVIPDSDISYIYKTSVDFEPDEDFLQTEISRWSEEVNGAERKALVGRSRTALAELEHSLVDIHKRVGRGQIGHNNPPEPLTIDETYRQCIAEVRAGIELHNAPRPNKAGLSRLLNILGRFQSWIRPRMDLAGDSSAKAFGNTIGIGVAGGLLLALKNALEFLGELILKLL